MTILDKRSIFYFDWYAGTFYKDIKKINITTSKLTKVRFILK